MTAGVFVFGLPAEDLFCLGRIGNELGGITRATGAVADGDGAPSDGLGGGDDLTNGKPATGAEIHGCGNAVFPQIIERERMCAG